MNTETKDFLQQIARQLEKWAQESLQGGWSTHQRTPQLVLAEQIYKFIGKQQPTQTWTRDSEVKEALRLVRALPVWEFISAVPNGDEWDIVWVEDAWGKQITHTVATFKCVSHANRFVALARYRATLGQPAAGVNDEVDKR